MNIFRKLSIRLKWYVKDKKMKSLTWCCVKGDFVRSKECGGDCETCNHFVTVEDLK